MPVVAVLSMLSMLPVLAMLAILPTLLLPLGSTASSMPRTARRPGRRTRSLTCALQIPPLTSCNRSNRHLYHTRVIDRSKGYFTVAHVAAELDFCIFCCGDGHDEFYAAFCAAVS